MSNFLQKKEIKNLFKDYGVTITGPTGSIAGIFDGAISLSLSANLSGNPLTNSMQEAMEGARDGLIGRLRNLGGGSMMGNFLASVANNVSQDLTKNLASSIKVYDSGGKFSINADFYYIPTLFHSKSYKELEEFSAKSTLPKKVLGVAGPYSQYLYNPIKVRGSLVPELETELFSIDIKGGKILVPGGLYITSISRSYSNEVDENNSPIYCKVSVSLEYFRDNFAEEYMSFINF